MSPIWTKFGGQIELDASNPNLKLFATYLIKQKSYARSKLKTHLYNAFCFLLLRIHSFPINVTHGMIRPDEHFRKHPTSPSSHVIPSSNTSSKKNDDFILCLRFGRNLVSKWNSTPAIQI